MEEPNITSEEMTNLNSQMKIFSKAVTDLNKTLLKTQGNFTNLKDTQKEINKQATEGKKALDGANKALSSMTEMSSSILANIGNAIKPIGKIGSLLTAGGVAAAMGRIASDALNLDITTSRMAARLGKQVQKAELKGAVNAVQKELGATYGDAVALVQTLSESRYTDNLKEAAKGAEAFGRFTGIGSSETAKLMNELNKGAHMSTGSINAMLASMMKVQNNVGLSQAGMSAVSEYIKKAAVNMSAFGKSSSDIQRMASQTTALASSLEKVGIAAGDATELVDRLTDPDKIEDNILLYSQLGVSMEDALSGNVDLSNMDNQLKDMAQRIVDMGPIAGSQFAKSMGLSYKQATQMAKLEGNQVGEVADQAQTAEEGAMDAMKELENQAMSFGEKTEKLFNKFEGHFRGWPLILQVGIGVVATYVMKKAGEIFKNLSDPKNKQYSAVTDAVGSSISEGFIRGLNIGIDKTQIAAVALARDIKQSFEASKINPLGDIDTQVKKVDALIAKATNKTPLDLFFNSAAENKKSNIESKMKVYEEKIEEMKKKWSELGGEEFKGGFQQASGLKEELVKDDEGGKKQKALQEIKKLAIEYEHSLTYQHKQLNKINDKYFINSKQQAKINEAARVYNERQKDLDKMLEKEASLKEESSKAIEKATKLAKLMNAAEMAGNKEKANSLKKEMEFQRAIAKMAKEQIDADAKDLEYQKEITKQAKEQLNAEQKKVTSKSLSKVGKLIKGTTMKIEQGARNAIGKTAFGQEYQKIKGAGEKNAVGKALGKTMLKGFGSITKMLGPMAIVMAIFGKLIDKVKEPLTKIMDNLMDCLMPVVDVLVGILGPLVNTLVKALMPPLLKTMAVILDVLHYILKPIVAILRLIAKLPFFKNNNPFTALADALDAVTGEATTSALRDAADKIAQGGADLSDAADKQEDAADKAATIKTSGGDLVQVDAASTSAKASSQASSTTQTVTENQTNSQLKEMENSKKEKKEEKHKATVEENMITIINKITELCNKLDVKVQNSWDNNAVNIKTPLEAITGGN